MKNSTVPRLVQWYEQRSLRERVVLLVCAAAVLLFVWNSLVMAPLDQRKKTAQRQTNQVELDLKELEARKLVVQARKDVDPDRENRALLEQLQLEVARVRQQLEKNIDNLVSPQEMPALLKQLLEEQQKLQLVRLENLPAESLQLGAQAESELGEGLLYRHRLELEFIGDYLATLTYLKKIEALPRRLVWDAVSIETEDYPQARVRLQVYTLSLSKGWIGG